MQVLSVSSIYALNKNITENNSKRPSVQSFGHHKDFHRLMQDYEVTASSYFRRGDFYGGPSDQFVDVINSLKLIFNENMFPLKDGKKTMMICGIGKSQEPYSLLAVIKSLIGSNKLEDVLNLNIIDLQSRPEEKELFYQSFYEYNQKPQYVPESFILEESQNYGYSRIHRYRVCDEIYKYLSDTYNNPDKSKWEKRIQEEMPKYPDSILDIASVNNTIGYIDNYKEGMSVLENIYRALKPSGIFITDPSYRKYREVFSPEVSDEIYPGIYQKKR